MKIVAINGSPKKGASNSKEVVSILHEMIGDLHTWSVITPIDAQRGRYSIDMNSIAEADVLIFAFPLYVDGLPASLMQFMCECATVLKHAPVESKRIFAVANCGFYEGVQNSIALRIMQHFTEAIQQRWGGGVGIGTGEMIYGLRMIPPQSGIRKPVFAALQRVANVIKQSPDGKLTDAVYTQHGLPWMLYKIMGEFGWRGQARKNKLKRGMLHARPLEIT